jgi:hypothetical protein
MDFLLVFAKVAVGVFLLGLAGGFVTAPFRSEHRFWLLLSPMCGLLVLPPAVTLVYSTDKFDFARSALIALTLCVGLTIISLFKEPPPLSSFLKSLPSWLLVTAAASGMFCAATIGAGSPSILYIDGSDHGGYAHAADWLMSHTISQQPVVSREYPYHSWPVVMFSGDFRYSSFVAVALMALANKSSGLFAYDPACAVAFATACLSIGAIFARSGLSLAVLSICLLTTTWFELGRDGYFGKLLAYPSCLFLLGLFMTSYRKITAQQMAVLVLLTVGAATMHSGIIIAFFFATIAGLLIGTDFLFDKTGRQPHFTDRFIAIGAIILVALASSGMFARPITAPGSPAGFFIEWLSLIPHLLEVQNPTRDYLTISDSWLLIGSAAALLLHLALVAVAILRRSAIAAALTAGPLLIFMALIILDSAGSMSARYAAYQFTSIIASFSLCGVAWLLDDAGRTRAPVRLMMPIAAICVALIMIRLPRTLGSLDTYAFNPPPTQVFKTADFDALAARIASQAVLIDAKDNINAIAVLVELGRRGVNLQWSPESWKAVVGYRAWSTPTYASEPTMVLRDRPWTANTGAIVYESAQFQLSDLQVPQTVYPSLDAYQPL